MQISYHTEFESIFKETYFKRKQQLQQFSQSSDRGLPSRSATELLYCVDKTHL